MTTEMAMAIAFELNLVSNRHRLLSIRKATFPHIHFVFALCHHCSGSEARNHFQMLNIFNRFIYVIEFRLFSDHFARTGRIS